MSPERALELLAPIARRIPFNRLVGIDLDRAEPHGATMSVDARPELANNPLTGTLHGGVTSSLLDTVGGMSAMSALAFERELDTPEAVLALFEQFGTVDLRIDYLRPGLGERFIGSGTVMRSGRRLAVIRMELTNDQGTLLAVGTGTYVTG